MPNPKDLLLSSVDYSSWATQLLIDACLLLEADELVRDLGGSHRSVLETLQHIYYAERVWVRRLKENAMPAMLGDQKLVEDPPPGPTLNQLARDWPAVWRAGLDWLKDLPDAELDETLGSRLPNGNDFRIARWQIVMHAVNHSTFHRGQVVGMLRALGKKPPSTDLFLYYLKPKK